MHAAIAFLSSNELYAKALVMNRSCRASASGPAAPGAHAERARTSTITPRNALMAAVIGADPGSDRGRRGGYAGESDAVMLLMVDLVGFDPAVGAGRFSPFGPLGMLNHVLFLATH